MVAAEVVQLQKDVKDILEEPKALSYKMDFQFVRVTEQLAALE